MQQRSARGIGVGRGSLGLHLLAAVLAGGAAAAALLEHGFYQPPLGHAILRTLQCLLVLGAVGASAARARSGGANDAPFGSLDWLILALAVLGGLGEALTPAPTWAGVHAAAGLAAFAELWRLNTHLSRRLHEPGVLFPASFLFLIAAGTLLLKMPVCVPPGEHLSWTDALFTMTSAVCVTGLVVVDTATAFSPLGHFVIAAFIQLGGLGIIIFGSTLALLLGARLSLRENLNLSHALDEYPTHEISSFVRFVVVTTVAIELVGAALLLPLWQDPVGGPPLPFAERVRWSAFHAISAFCNAGFDITGSSLLAYRNSPLPHLVIAPLVVLGGLGFIVLQELWRRGWSALAPSGSGRRFGGAGGGRRRLSLHTRLVLTTTLALYLAGAALIFASQAVEQERLDAVGTVVGVDPSVATRGLAGHLLDAQFFSLTARSGGFSTLAAEDLHPGTRFVLMLLMFAGGSPGGTGGGAKTTVIALLFLAVLATLRRRDETEAAGRAISDVFVKRAAAIACYIVTLIAAVTLAISLIEHDLPLEPILFEAVSACTTTGLSLGITPQLGTPGKLVIVAAMFLGRVGPLVLFGSLLFSGRRSPRYAYPHEPVALG